MQPPAAEFLREFLLDDSNESMRVLTPQLRTFYRFHVYFTTRRILYEMGGISSKGALPDDPAFNQKENLCDTAAYKQICAEFGVDPSSDFRHTYGKNHGLGNVFIGIYGEGIQLVDYDYLGEPDLALFSMKHSRRRHPV